MGLQYCLLVINHDNQILFTMCKPEENVWSENKPRLSAVLITAINPQCTDVILTLPGLTPTHTFLTRFKRRYFDHLISRTFKLQSPVLTGMLRTEHEFCCCRAWWAEACRGNIRAQTALQKSAELLPSFALFARHFLTAAVFQLFALVVVRSDLQEPAAFYLNHLKETQKPISKITTSECSSPISILIYLFIFSNSLFCLIRIMVNPKLEQSCHKAGTHPRSIVEHHNHSRENNGDARGNLFKWDDDDDDDEAKALLRSNPDVQKSVHLSFGLNIMEDTRHNRLQCHVA